MAQANVLTKPYTQINRYYEGAWRDHLTPLHLGDNPTAEKWNNNDMRNALGYLWASRTRDEDAACRNLADHGRLTLPVIDHNITPMVRVGTRPAGGWDAVAHPRANDRIGDARPADAGEVRGQITVQVQAQAPPRKVNTTNMPFWPQTGDLDAPLPPCFPEGNEKRIAADLALFGTLLDPADEENSWESGRFLGEGSGGRAILWTKLDENRSIIDRMAVKDNKAMGPKEWINPINWRDRLPKEIAVMQRLKSLERRNIIGFRGYRLNMKQRRWRLLQDYCDYKDLREVLLYYEHRFCAERRKRWDQARKANDKFVERLPQYIIPESFIWYVFDALVDAFTGFKNGKGEDYREAPWREIIHGDLCAYNIFVAQPRRADGTYNYNDKGDPYSIGGKRFPGFYSAGRDQWPHLLVADFDQSFFDLQSEVDGYQDNPFHYTGDTAGPGTGDDIDGRYPPERYRDYHRELCARRHPTDTTRDPFSSADMKITNQADVWAIGQVIWNLVQNLAAGNDHSPFLDSERMRSFSNGTRLVTDDFTWLKHDWLATDFMSGDEPYDVVTQYSDELKDLVRRCLAWDMADRPTVEELRVEVDRARVSRPADDEELIIKVPDGVDDFAPGHTFKRKKRREDEDVDGDEG